MTDHGEAAKRFLHGATDFSDCRKVPKAPVEQKPVGVRVVRPGDLTGRRVILCCNRVKIVLQTMHIIRCGSGQAQPDQ
jgi:hypothetical protein